MLKHIIPSLLILCLPFGCGKKSVVKQQAKSEKTELDAPAIKTFNVAKGENKKHGMLDASTLGKGLVAHYKFDGDFTDSSGNGCNLTLTSGTVSTSATNVLIGSGSFESDDTLNYKLSLPTTIDLRNTDFTISIWFNINKRITLC